jgi:hypothetical protein
MTDERALGILVMAFRTGEPKGRVVLEAWKHLTMRLVETELVALQDMPADLEEIAPESLPELGEQEDTKNFRRAAGRS